jgi:hypothetical protein
MTFVTSGEAPTHEPSVVVADDPEVEDEHRRTRERDEELAGPSARMSERIAFMTYVIALSAAATSVGCISRSRGQKSASGAEAVTSVTPNP